MDDANAERGREILRGVSWGLNEAEVREREDALLLNEAPGELTYFAKYGGIGCFISYHFVDSRLVEISIKPKDPGYSDVSSYFGLHNAMKQMGSQIMGMPVEDTTVLSYIEEYRQDPQAALLSGHGILATEWKGRDTVGSLHMKRDVEQSIIFINLSLRSRSFAAKQDRASSTGGSGCLMLLRTMGVGVAIGLGVVSAVL